MIPVGGPVGKSRAAENCMYGQQPQDAAAGKGRLQAVRECCFFGPVGSFFGGPHSRGRGTPIDRCASEGQYRSASSLGQSRRLSKSTVGLRSGCAERGAVLVPVNLLQGPLAGNVRVGGCVGTGRRSSRVPFYDRRYLPKTDSSWRCQRTRCMRRLPMRTPTAAWQRSPWRDPCPASTDGCCDKGGKRAL